MRVSFWLVLYYVIEGHIIHQSQSGELQNFNDTLNSTRNEESDDYLKTTDSCFPENFDYFAVCFIGKWYPEFLQKKSGIISTVYIMTIHLMENNNLHLTKKHIEGLSEVKYLEICGKCNGNCTNPYGILSMDDDTFEATPKLFHLTLENHPLKSTEALHKLKSLRYLILHGLPALKLISSSLDNMRENIKSIKLNDVNIINITRDHFKDMTELVTLEVFTLTKSLFIHPFGLRNLPNLRNLSIGKGGGDLLTLYMEENAINNLPNLRKVTLTNILEAYGDPYFSCKGNFNIERLYIQSSSENVIFICPLLLQCIKCGRYPKKYPQTVIIQGSAKDFEMSGFKAIMKVVGRRRILTLNISRLILKLSDFPYSFDVFYMTPLLKEFILDESGNDRPLHTISIKRLNSNPFALLPKGVHFEKVRITHLRCDCEILKIIKWFEDTQKPNYRKSVSEILQLECLYITGLCNPKRKTIGNPLYSDLSLVKKKLKIICGIKDRSSPLLTRSKRPCFCEELTNC